MSCDIDNESDEWVEGDDDFGELDKKFNNDQDVMNYTGISQSYYHVDVERSAETELLSPTSEKSFNEEDLNPVERSIEEHSPRNPNIMSNIDTNTENEEEMGITWWERGVVGVVVALGAFTMIALSRRK